MVRSTAGAGAGARSAMVLRFLCPSRAARVSRRFCFCSGWFLGECREEGGEGRRRGEEEGKGGGGEDEAGEALRERERKGRVEVKQRKREEREERKERSRFPALCSAPSSRGGGARGTGGLCCFCSLRAKNKRAVGANSGSRSARSPPRGAQRAGLRSSLLRAGTFRPRSLGNRRSGKERERAGGGGARRERKKVEGKTSAPSTVMLRVFEAASLSPASLALSIQFPARQRLRN